MGNWHYLGPVGLSEIFHLHFMFTEFLAQTFPALAHGCSQICKAETSHPAVADRTWLAALTLTQLSLPVAGVHRLCGIYKISHGDSIASLRSVLWVLTMGVWQEQGTVSFI